MTFLVVFLLGTFISWVSLLIVIPIAQKLADFSFPPWGEALWKLAIVAAAANLAEILGSLANGMLGLIAGAVVFFALMFKWFDVDFFGAIIIVFVSWLLRILVLAWLLMPLMILLSS